jgi:SAM-dependent methyltransferase
MSMLEDGGRITPDSARSPYEKALLSRHLFAYAWTAENFIDPGDTVLEIGSGEGYGSAILAGKARRVTAIDAGTDAIAHAAARYARPNLEFMVHGGESLPFADATFDKAVSFQVIEHLGDPAAFLKEAARVLKPGGKLCITTPNRIHRLKQGQKPWYKFHVREFSAEELRALLSKAFSGCEVKFISVPREHFEMELKMARMASLAQKLDPLGLRDLVPYRLKKQLFRFFSTRSTAPAPETGTDVFRVVARDETGLDLLAEAVKR